MRTTKHFIVMLLCVLLYVPTALAQKVQDKQHDAQNNNTISHDVMIIIQQEKVRFTAEKAVAEMQLKVFDQSSELIYDSGVTPEPELNWPLRNANGKAVKSGLYAYQLLIKEAGTETARLRRGHLIVDRAKERDGQTDWLRITSQQDSGVGTELTVARNEGVTVAGTSASTDQKSARATRDGKGESENEKTEASAAAANGTTGRIAKFTSATDLGNSVMTELNGNIGIGTANPQGKLDVSGNIVLNGNAKTQLSASGDVTFLNGGVVVAKGRFIELDMSSNGSGILDIGSNPNDDKVFLFGFSADRTRSAAAMWFAGKDGGKLPLIQMSADKTLIEAFVEVTGDIQLDRNLVVGGQTRTKTLQIVGGSDFSENFDIDARPSSALEAMNVKPGLVVSIDPAHPGKLTLSTQAYDRHVAGIISGAGGVNPGVMMSQAGTLADGQHPVALSGRVYCWVDASHGAIKPGDLLTTSDTPGHAMKVTDHAKAQGAIIGKAMTELKQGKGLVLVLVTLQ